MQDNLKNLSNLIQKGNQGRIVLLSFPHKEICHRNDIEDPSGRYLGP